MSNSERHCKGKPKAKTKRQSSTTTIVTDKMVVVSNHQAATCLVAAPELSLEPRGRSNDHEHIDPIFNSTTPAAISSGESCPQKDSPLRLLVRPVEPQQIAINLIELNTEPEVAAAAAHINDDPAGTRHSSASAAGAAQAADSSTRSLDNVRQHYVTLIRHNKLQYFLLGALTYTVMSIGVILEHILNMNHHQESSFDSLCWILLSVNLTLLATLSATLASLTFTFMNTTTEVALDKKEQVVVRRRWIQTVGILVTLVSISVQSIVDTFLGECCVRQEVGARAGQTRNMISDNLLSPDPKPVADNKYNQNPARLWWSMSPIIVVIYFLPLLLEGDAQLDRGARRCLLLLSPSLLALMKLWLYYWPPLASQSTFTGGLALIQLTCLLLALMFGLKMRRDFSRAITKTTFAGAAQLIEAKVSLEHQRQQQETLLLSVLPAYVAEQVKRNMLKKTTSATTAVSSTGDSSETVCVVPTIIAPVSPPLPPTSAGQCPAWKSRSFTTLHGNFQSSSESAPQVEATTKQSTLQVADKGAPRNSFHMPTKALTSGLAAISESLVASLADSKSDHQSRKSVTGCGSQQQPAASSAMSIPQVVSTSGYQSAAGPMAGQARRGFNELYIRTYNNVSLLYGDIVGFTRLCTQLSSSQLVRALNDLFSHFDHLAERHRIMRIKILGDCYYGVSGIPEFAVMGAKSRASRNDNHAINCVNMGLDMIHYIRCLNVERASLSGGAKDSQLPASNCGTPLPPFELNMRIGIHTGHIHSGVIGLKKWQFDVWSNDVSIAMHCESSGVAGRVHVTQATVQQLNGAFTYEQAYASRRDSFLASKDIQTYLIKDRIHEQRTNLHPATDHSLSMNPSSQQQPQRIASGQQQGVIDARPAPDMPTSGSKKFASFSCEPGAITQKVEEFNIWAATIGTIRQILLAGETCNANGMNSYGLGLNHHDIWPLTLSYHDQRMRRHYASKRAEVSLAELTIFSCLATTIYLINVHIHQLPLWGRWFLVSLSAASVLLLLVETTTTIRGSDGSEQSAEQQQAIQDPLDLLEPHQVIKDVTAEASGSWPQCALDKIRQARRFFDRPLSIGSSRSRLEATLTLLVSVCFLLTQFHQLVQVSTGECGPERTSFRQVMVTGDGSLAMNNRWWLQRQKYELTVILLLFLLNSTVSLIGYKTKSLLILAMLTWHLIKMLFIAWQPMTATGGWTECDHHHNQHHQIETEAKPSGSSYASLFVGLTDTLLVAAMLWSLALARQIEYTNKTNFLWRNRLNVDHEELEYISGINKVLLENILPSHVVQHYLTHPNEQPKNQLMPNLSAYMRMSFSNLRDQTNGLYHEQHDSVAVMFASIPHFYEFYDESDISKQGLGCIALLNEIICDFDKLLLKNKFSRIEKIKTIGSSYMAAAGLRPSNLGSGARPSNASQCSTSSSIPPSYSSPIKRFGGSHQVLGGNLANVASIRDPNGSDQLMVDDRRLVICQQKLNLICMIKFATSLMTALNGINKQSFQAFKLRVGVNTGPVIAGIIGAQRPFYDIWGDCVNIASRMESLGEVGRIQVEERTAKLLMDSLCPETYSIAYRGNIDVKGKGGMVTYFVDRRETYTAGDDLNSQQPQQRVENIRLTSTAQQVETIHGSSRAEVDTTSTSLINNSSKTAVGDRNIDFCEMD